MTYHWDLQSISIGSKKKRLKASLKVFLIMILRHLSTIGRMRIVRHHIMAIFPTIEVQEITEKDTDLGTGTDFEAEVIVHNCDCHTYQQVVDLFCRFIPDMTSTRAFELAWQIDHQGSAQVYQGSKKMADNIAAKLASGGLRVEVR